MAFEQANNFKEYQQYLRLRDEWQEMYHGINLTDAMSADIIRFIVAKESASWYLVGCVLLKRLHTQDLLNAFHGHRNVCTFDAPRRNDHNRLSQLIQSSIDDSCRVQLGYYYRPWGVVFSFVGNFFKIRKHLSLSLVNHCYLAALMTSYQIIVRQLEKTFRGVDLTGKALIPFCAPAYVEALLTLFFKGKGVTTFCTVHGYFGRYRLVIAGDVVNGCNILSDKVLTFGRYQKEDLIRDFGIEENRVCVAGNPKYPCKDLNYANECRKVLVLGGISRYDDDLRMLFPVAEQVAQEYNVCFVLKPHPLSAISNDDLKEFEHIRLLDKSVVLTELLASGEYDCAITHNTFAYYECMYYGVMPFRWGLNENLAFETLDDSFLTKEQLVKYISELRTGVDSNYSEKARRLLTDVLGMGINRYNEIINGI